MNRLNQVFGEDQPSGTPLSALASEAFVECPSVFFENLTPEQFVAKQQLYRAAWEKAQQQLQGEFDFGIGSGI